MTAWWVIIGGGLGTYLMRASFLGLLGDGVIPGPVRRMLKYVGPAAFAAIVLPLVVGKDGASSFASLPDARFLAAAVGAAVIWKWRSFPMLLIVGMAALWLFEAAGL